MIKLDKFDPSKVIDKETTDKYENAMLRLHEKSAHLSLETQQDVFSSSTHSEYAFQGNTSTPKALGEGSVIHAKANLFYDSTSRTLNKETSTTTDLSLPDRDLVSFYKATSLASCFLLPTGEERCNDWLDKTDWDLNNLLAANAMLQLTDNISMEDDATVVTKAGKIIRIKKDGKTTRTINYVDNRFSSLEYSQTSPFRHGPILPTRPCATELYSANCETPVTIPFTYLNYEIARTVYTNGIFENHKDAIERSTILDEDHSTKVAGCGENIVYSSERDKSMVASLLLPKGIGKGKVGGSKDTTKLDHRVMCVPYASIINRKAAEDNLILEHNNNSALSKQHTSTDHPELLPVDMSISMEEKEISNKEGPTITMRRKLGPRDVHCEVTEDGKYKTVRYMVDILTITSSANDVPCKNNSTLTQQEGVHPFINTKIQEQYNKQISPFIKDYAKKCLLPNIADERVSTDTFRLCRSPITGYATDIVTSFTFAKTKLFDAVATECANRLLDEGLMHTNYKESFIKKYKSFLTRNVSAKDLVTMTTPFGLVPDAVNLRSSMGARTMHGLVGYTPYPHNDLDVISFYLKNKDKLVDILFQQQFFLIRKQVVGDSYVSKFGNPYPFQILNHRDGSIDKDVVSPLILPETKEDIAFPVSETIEDKHTKIIPFATQKEQTEASRFNHLVSSTHGSIKDIVAKIPDTQIGNGRSFYDTINNNYNHPAKASISTNAFLWLLYSTMFTSFSRGMSLCESICATMCPLKPDYGDILTEAIETELKQQLYNRLFKEDFGASDNFISALDSYSMIDQGLADKVINTIVDRVTSYYSNTSDQDINKLKLYMTKYVNTYVRIKKLSLVAQSLRDRGDIIAEYYTHASNLTILHEFSNDYSITNPYASPCAKLTSYIPNQVKGYPASDDPIATRLRLRDYYINSTSQVQTNTCAQLDNINSPHEDRLRAANYCARANDYLISTMMNERNSLGLHEDSDRESSASNCQFATGKILSNKQLMGQTTDDFSLSYYRIINTNKITVPFSTDEPSLQFDVSHLRYSNYSWQDANRYYDMSGLLIPEARFCMANNRVLFPSPLDYYSPKSEKLITDHLTKAGLPTMTSSTRELVHMGDYGIAQGYNMSEDEAKLSQLLTGSYHVDAEGPIQINEYMYVLPVKSDLCNSPNEVSKRKTIKRSLTKGYEVLREIATRKFKEDVGEEEFNTITNNLKHQLSDKAYIKNKESETMIPEDVPSNTINYLNFFPLYAYLTAASPEIAGDYGYQWAINNSLTPHNKDNPTPSSIENLKLLPYRINGFEKQDKSNKDCFIENLMMLGDNEPVPQMKNNGSNLLLTITDVRLPDGSMNQEFCTLDDMRAIFYPGTYNYTLLMEYCNGLSSRNAGGYKNDVGINVLNAFDKLGKAINNYNSLQAMEEKIKMSSTLPIFSSLAEFREVSQRYTESTHATRHEEPTQTTAQQPDNSTEAHTYLDLINHTLPILYRYPTLIQISDHKELTNVRGFDKDAEAIIEKVDKLRESLKQTANA